MWQLFVEHLIRAIEQYVAARERKKARRIRKRRNEGHKIKTRAALVTFPFI